jgi:hypothetical protein
MSTYVDDMKAGYGRMVMCHMIADTPAELLAMADNIGVARRWIQCAGTHREHFDICLTMREKAVAAGAIEVTQRELGLEIRRRRLARMKPAPPPTPTPPAQTTPAPSTAPSSTPAPPPAASPSRAR